MTARVGIVLFPGSNRDIDAANALRIAGAEPVVLWHESVDLEGVTAILIPQFHIQSPALLFNRKHVDMLAQVTERKEKKQTGELP